MQQKKTSFKMVLVQHVITVKVYDTKKSSHFLWPSKYIKLQDDSHESCRIDKYGLIGRD